MNTKIIITILILICGYLTTLAQVTIGVGTPPVSGSLLQLKENEGVDVNSTKGLTLPRVKLTSKTNLYPMFESEMNTGLPNSSYDEPQEKTAEDNKHAGMVIYHVDNCTMQGKGLYVWSGTEWEKLGEESLAKLSLSATTLDFPSGQDLRGAVQAKTFIVDWSPKGTGSIAPTWTLGTTGTLAPNMTPASGSLSTTLPQTMTVQLAAMTAEDIAANTFATRTKTITFNSGAPCNLTQPITITQTNYALKANTSLSNTTQAYTVAGNGSFAVQSNARWTTSKSDPNNLLSAISPAVGTTTGTESTLTNTSFAYNIAAGSKHQTAVVTFSDTNTPKRFNDVKVSIVNCSNTPEPTMQQWKDQLVAANGGSLAQDVPGANGVAWHRDQNNNIFLSMNYDAANPKGNNNRWMTTNLAATSFADSGRTGSDNSVLLSFGPSPSANSDNRRGLWAYPSATSPVTTTEFTNTERLGRLYNWAAASNALGGTVDGMDYVGFAQGAQSYPTHRKIQGICPNGWHLPSDYEWTEFENEIIKNTASYSSTTSPATPVLLDPADYDSQGWRPAGGIQGKAILDMCEPTLGFGTSNLPLSGGFAALYVGMAIYGNNKDLGINSYFWSSSSQFHGTAWIRLINNSTTSLYRYWENSNKFFSVRCKKD